MKKRTDTVLLALGLGAMALVGCAKAKAPCNWQMASASAPPVIHDRPEAPDWVRGLTPQSNNTIYFVGRSDDACSALSERDAMQSARNDIHDQIRQRLAPRNVGTTGQAGRMMVDSGTCIDCGSPMPKAAHTPVEQPCNAPCLQAGTNLSKCASRSHCNPCGRKALKRGSAVEIESSCGSCNQFHLFVASRDADCQSCPTLVHAVNADHRAPDYLPYSSTPMDRDINVFNVGLDSVMPALLAHLQEETAYLEHDGAGDRAWLLCSIPRAEFLSIANEFRSRYEQLYDMTLGWSIDDRERRIEWETTDRRTELEWKMEERAWNREDEVVARDHTISLDKDRHPLPGRRFSVSGSQ